MIKTPNTESNKFIPLVLDKNRSLFLILSQHGLQIASNNKRINIFIFQMTG